MIAFMICLLILNDCLKVLYLLSIKYIQIIFFYQQKKFILKLFQKAQKVLIKVIL